MTEKTHEAVSDIGSKQSDPCACPK